MKLLRAHAKIRDGKGPLKPKVDEIREAVAELQEAMKRVDPSFQPKRPAKSGVKTAGTTATKK